MKRDPVRASVLSSKIIPNVSPELAKKLGLSPEHKSLALLTTDCDDVGYTAIDEATKKADVSVVYAKSFYGGAANANTKLAGEFIGMLAGPNPAEVKAGLQAAVDMVENGAYFISANEDDSIVYYAQCISRTGSYLSDCTASGSHVRRRCRHEGRRRGAVCPVRTSFRDQLRRRAADRQPVGLQVGLRSLCRSR